MDLTRPGFLPASCRHDQDVRICRSHYEKLGSTICRRAGAAHEQTDALCADPGCAAKVAWATFLLAPRPGHVTEGRDPLIELGLDDLAV